MATSDAREVASIALLKQDFALLPIDEDILHSREILHFIFVEIPIIEVPIAQQLFIIVD